MSGNSLTIQSLIRTHYPAFSAQRKLRADVRRAAHRIMQCQTASLGVHLQSCPCGHSTKLQYNSCRHRSCPCCSGGRRARWLQNIAARLLPCEHVHVVFTVPDALNVLWQFNRQNFAMLLMRAARESLTELLADPKYLGATPGILAALHTWGRNLSIHPHVHCLVTAGGMNDQGRFVPLKRAILLPARVLRAVFRGKLLAALRRELDAGRLNVPSSLTPARLRSLLNRLGRTDWNVRLMERYPHGTSVAGYLARYITGGPMSDHRLRSASGSHVTFAYRDFRTQTQRLLTLTTHAFLARWFEHVPPRGLRTVSHSGLYANARVPDREAARSQIETAPDRPQVSERTRPVHILAPDTCPRCNHPVVRHPIHVPLVSPPRSQESPLVIQPP